jgi:hypothetical protein
MFHEFYPDPAFDWLYGDIFSTDEEDTVIEVADMRGAAILSQRFHLCRGVNKVAISLASLVAGEYVVNIISEHGRFSRLLTVTHCPN